MSTLAEAAQEFLSQPRIAVVGVSRTKRDAANLIYCKLREQGHRVFPINPSAQTVEGDRCYPALAALPEKVDGVVIVTKPKNTEHVVQECVELGIPRVWMHQSMGFLGTSISEQAVKLCQDNGITVIPGGCPMMFCEPVDTPHKCMRWFLRLTGGLPKQV